MLVSFNRLLLVLSVSVVATLAAPTINHDKEKLERKKGKHLIQLDKDSNPVWMTEEEELELIKADKHFMDITETEFMDDYQGIVQLVAPVGYEGKLHYPDLSMQSTVRPFLTKISLPRMQGYLGNLTAFPTRFFKSKSGIAASNWIYDTVVEMTHQFPKSGAKAIHIKHHGFPQRSIIVKIPGRNHQGPITILGSHMDTFNGENPLTGLAPGADDDGSGSTNLLEALRVLLCGGFIPENPVEFHWYAGEEMGLRGSLDIARHYKQVGNVVAGMMQMDMTAYVFPNTTEAIYLIPDFVNVDLTNFVASLVDEYSILEWEMSTPCEYGCSDHASWDKYGFPTAFPVEGNFSTKNDFIHKAIDTVDAEGWNWNHMLEFTKLAIAFAVELGSHKPKAQ